MSYKKDITNKTTSGINVYPVKSASQVSLDEKIEIIKETFAGKSRALIAHDHNVSQSSIALWVKELKQALPKVFTPDNGPDDRLEDTEKLVGEKLPEGLSRDSVTETDIRIERKLLQIISELKKLREDVESFASKRSD